MGVVNLFSASSGINNRVDPARVRFDPETGVSDLVVAVNVTHDDAGSVSRRKGKSLAVAGDFHSLFVGNGECYAGEGTDLYRLGDGLTLMGVRSSLNGERISYAATPHGIYYSNGKETGVLKEGVSIPWFKGEYVGPETSRNFESHPKGQHLEVFSGRMFIAEDDVLWWSEPYAFGLYDKARSFVQFKSRIRMVKAVAGGLYVSDENTTYFLGGTNPQEFVQRTVVGSPALEWAEEHELVPSSELGIDGAGMCALWAGTDGVYVGTDQGQVIPWNKDKVAYPRGLSKGAGVLVGRNFIHAMT